MDDDASIASYTESLANFGAAYAAMQESMKSQATTMAAMQGQLTNIQQLCMAVGQQPPPNIYAPSQQQPTFNNRRNRRNGGGHGNGNTIGNNGGGNFPQQPTWFGGNGAGAQQPTPTWVRHGRYGRRCVNCITRELQSRSRCHARIKEVPGNHHGHYARPIDEHPAIMHCCWPTAPAQHLGPFSTATHIQQSPQQTQRWRPRQRRYRR